MSRLSPGQYNAACAAHHYRRRIPDHALKRAHSTTCRPQARTIGQSVIAAPPLTCIPHSCFSERRPRHGVELLSRIRASTKFGEVHTASTPSAMDRCDLPAPGSPRKRTICRRSMNSSYASAMMQSRSRLGWKLKLPLTQEITADPGRDCRR